MNDSTLISINDAKRFLKSSNQIQFEKKYKTEAYQWIEQTLVKFSYTLLGHKLRLSEPNNAQFMT